MMPVVTRPTIRRRRIRAILAGVVFLIATPVVGRTQDANPKRTQLSGRVTGVGGRPIDGALVDLGGSRPPTGPGTEPWLLTTDSLGRFFFDSAVVNGFIRVRSFGYLPYVKELHLRAPKAALTVKLDVDTSVANTCTRMCDLVYHRRTPRQLSALQRRVRAPVTPDSADIVAVYRAVLDSLLSMRGESPKLIVLPDSTFGGFSFCTRRPCEILPPHRSVIDSETLRAFDDDRHRRRGSGEYETPSFSYRIPIVFQSEADRNEMMRLGVALGQNQYAPGMYDVEGFWRSFRQIYPGAWGATWLSRADFNGTRDQALLHVMHICGSGCRSAEIVYLRKHPAGWRIAERIPVPQNSEEGWNVAPLRYIAEGGTHAQQELDLANARRAARADSIRLWNLPRSIHGTVTHWTSGLPIEHAVIAMHFGPSDSIKIVRANVRGEFRVRNPPIGPAMLEVRCAEPNRGSHAGLIGFHRVLGAPALYVTPATDTTFDIRVQDVSPCWRNFRYHKLDAAGELETPASPNDASSDVMAAYASVLSRLERIHGDSTFALTAITDVPCRARDDCDMRDLDALVAKEAILSETAAAFVLANQNSRPLPGIASARHVLITSGERRFLEDQAQSRMTYSDAGVDALFWRAFGDTHSGSHGIVTLSAIGFNERKTEAIVQAVYEAPEEMTRSEYLILKKKNGAWR